MSGLDIEGVLAAKFHDPDDTPWMGHGTMAETCILCTEIAAVLREQIAAWLVAEADWRWEPDSEIPAVLAELAALVACVDPSRSDGGSTDPEVRQSADRTSSPSRVPGEET